MLRSVLSYGFNAVFFYTMLSANTAFSTPINAVIGLDHSQVVENGQNSLSIIPGSLTPLEERFPAILQNQATHYDHWINQVDNSIRIEHKQRDLSFTGQLLAVQHQLGSFRIKIGNRVSQLPLNDFYLFPLEEANQERQPVVPHIPLSYQTDQLAWTPQLNLIIEDQRIGIFQKAMLHNRSSINITLDNALLHYFRRPNAVLQQKNNRALVAMESATPAEVQNTDNEITYPLSDQSINIPAFSDLLYPLPSSKSNIEKQTHATTLHTHQNSRGEIPLSFDHQLTFQLSKDSLPGQYQIFWKKGQLLIPSNKAMLDNPRAGEFINITTNQSQDISGHLTLLETSSRKLPSFQTWQAVITNHSSEKLDYSITQNTNAIVNLIKGKGVETINANDIQVSGQVKPHSTKTVTYQIEMKN